MPAASNTILVDITDVRKRYHLGDETIHALRGVSLTIDRGRFVAIMGASGSGKTTLLHLIGGLDVPDEGRITVAGQDLTRLSDHVRTLLRRRQMGIVFQAYNLIPSLTARENVMLPLLVDGQPSARIHKKADELLDRVHLKNRANHRPTALSGGEQQRVAIARALINDPILLLADEPTGNLDPKSSFEIWKLLRNLANETAATIIMVTHEAAAASHADVVHVLKEGELAGLIEAGGSGDASLVATRYAELAG